MNAPVTITGYGGKRLVNAVATGVRKMIIAGLIDQYQANGKDSPNSRRVYLGHVRCACWKMRRTNVSSAMNPMNTQNAGWRSTSRAIESGFFAAGAPAGWGASRNRRESPTLMHDAMKP